MRRSKLHLLILGFLLGYSIFGAPVRAQESITGQDDIARLISTAGTEFDPEKYDAVFLLDEATYQWTADRRLITTVHRIIRVGSEIGVEVYADHRIPYDNENCTFKVNTLRTWRDNQSWETGETGIVETLPGNLRSAYAYTNMREMMLLHDGVEVPCILEVSYTIEDKRPFRNGIDGMWLFAKEQPTVKSRLSLVVPQGMTQFYYSSPGVPEPEVIVSDDEANETYIWSLGPLPMRPVPEADAPARYTPHVIWSTWQTWATLGKYIGENIKAAGFLDSTMISILDSLLRDSRTGPEKANLIADFIDKRTSFIDYPEKYWLASPRSAIDVYNSAYGHRLDRAVLAEALYTKAGFSAVPVFISNEFGTIDSDIPSLARLGKMGIWVSGPDIEAYYDPEESSLQRGLSQITGRTIWSPGVDEQPGIRIGGTSEYSNMEIIIDLTIDSASDTISGHGFLFTDNCLNVFDRMEGLSGEAREFLNEAMGGVIDGIEISDYSFDRFDIFNVTAGFEFDMKKPEKDDYDRLPFKTGNPVGGIYDHLPENISLYDAGHLSPISLQCLMRCAVELRIALKGMQAVYIPSDMKMENKAGGVAVTVKRDDDRIDIRRELYISRVEFEPALWPDLRNLLLLDSNERNRTVLLKAEEKEK